jgi:hypothetical protein
LRENGCGSETAAWRPGRETTPPYNRLVARILWAFGVFSRVDLLTFALLEGIMADKHATAPAVGKRRPTADGSQEISGEALIELLNEDLAREYQAIIAYVVYSQTLRGAAYMSIA